MVTGSGYYYSADKYGNPVSVYYAQGLDHTSGMRVWDTGQCSFARGDVVDVMAKLSRMDNERMLGVFQDSSSVEYALLATSQGQLLPTPVGMPHRSLGRSALGFNPGITGAQSLYNVDSYVTVCGWVIAVEPYALDPYMWLGEREDDEPVPGSGVIVLDQLAPLEFSVGGGGDHRATESVRDFLEQWVDNQYSPIGGDDPELQLDALYHRSFYVLCSRGNPADCRHKDRRGRRLSSGRVLAWLQDSHLGRGVADNPRPRRPARGGGGPGPVPVTGEGSHHADSGR